MPQQELDRLIAEMRSIAIVAGQYSVEDHRVGTRMAAAEAERATRWADVLERLRAAAASSPPPTERDAVTLLRRIRQWDHLDGAADGPYWKQEIDNLLSGLASSPGAREAQLDPLDERKLRECLWLWHGHDGLYGDDGEMQCGKCLPTWDYKNAPLGDVVRQARKARQEVNLAALSEARAESGAPPTPETPIGANAALLAAVDRYNSDNSFGTNPDAMTTEELLEALDAWVDTVRPTPETPEEVK